MAFNASQFRSHLQFGGTRSNLFEVIMTFPSFVGLGAAAGEKFKFTAKATSLPGMTLGTIEVPYFGRTLKLAGDRTFEEWQVTLINDEDFLVRNAVESWSSAIANVNYDTNNSRSPQALRSNASYTSDFIINQYGKAGNIIKSYKMFNAFPTIVDPIEIAWESNDQIQEFGVTFAYDYYQSSDVDS